MWKSLLPILVVICTSYIFLISATSAEETVVNMPLPGDFSDMTDDFEKKSNKGIPCETDDHQKDTLTRSGLTDADKKWKNIRFFLNGSYSTPQIRRIRISFEIVHQAVPCVTYEHIDKPLAPEESYVIIHKRGNCGSNIIGRTGKQQDIDLEDKCADDMPTIIHYILHLLGVNHENNRFDRDEYITVLWGNIDQDQLSKFALLEPPEYSTYNVAYNTKSVMHYDEYAYHTHKGKTWKTNDNPKEAPNKPVSFGPFKNTGLQWSDVEKLRAMYGCG